MALYPSGYEEIAIGATVKSLTVPANVEAVLIHFRGSPIRYRMDGGTPTASFGIPLSGNDENLTLTVAEAVGFRAIAESATCTARVTYYSRS